MSAAELKAAATGAGTAIAKKEPKNFPAMLDAYKSEVARALPKHLNADRMARIALTEFRRSPKLADCDPRSVFAAVIMLSQLGLEPGVLGQAYLIPYGRECQGIPGWKGLVDLVTRTGRATVDAQTVFAGDHFVYAKGTRPFIEHTESGREPPDRSMLSHAYAVGWVKGAEHAKFEVWTRERVVAHRDRFNKVGKRHYSYEHFEQYAKKVVLLQVLKYLPASPELQTAIGLEHAAERGGQGLDMGNVLDGSWAPVEETTPQQDQSAASSGGDYILQFDKPAALKAIKESGSVIDLNKAWTSIALDYQMSNREVEPDIEDAVKTQRELLTKL